MVIKVVLIARLLFYVYIEREGLYEKIRKSFSGYGNGNDFIWMWRW